MKTARRADGPVYRRKSLLLVVDVRRLKLVIETLGESVTVRPLRCLEGVLAELGWHDSYLSVVADDASCFILDDLTLAVVAHQIRDEHKEVWILFVDLQHLG